MKQNDIIAIVIENYPSTQAIYMFGTHSTEDEWADSDVDIALLLPPAEAKQAGNLQGTNRNHELEKQRRKDVDWSNVRLVSTVFQKEIIAADRRIYCADEYAADEFDMLTFSYYQKLNEERAGILDAAKRSGRFLNV